ncbi:hypothetical protein [Bacillus sp. FJAT-49754]|uniref:hypothetical protein n=1 Tax=Lederbergia citrea TaxID=2833581 RepID=UPI001BC9C543|nr:hypothetical protein [Lederbergia citrea]
MIETKEQLLVELNKSEDWEKNQNGLWFWEKLGRLELDNRGYDQVDHSLPSISQTKFDCLSYIKILKFGLGSRT